MDLNHIKSQLKIGQYYYSDQTLDAVTAIRWLVARVDKLVDLLEDVRDISFDGDCLKSAKDLGEDIAGMIEKELKKLEGK